MRDLAGSRCSPEDPVWQEFSVSNPWGQSALGNLCACFCPLQAPPFLLLGHSFLSWALPSSPCQELTSWSGRAVHTLMFARLLGSALIQDHALVLLPSLSPFQLKHDQGLCSRTDAAGWQSLCPRTRACVGRNGQQGLLLASVSARPTEETLLLWLHQGGGNKAGPSHQGPRRLEKVWFSREQTRPLRLGLGAGMG